MTIAGLILLPGTVFLAWAHRDRELKARRWLWRGTELGQLDTLTLGMTESSAQAVIESVTPEEIVCGQVEADIAALQF